MEEELKINSDRMALLVIGMAGTGKTTFVNQLNTYLRQQQDVPYIVNIDPAVHSTPYTPDIDIRKDINYKELMTKHQLGPNGAIMTALNLYCLQINTLLDGIEDLPKEKKHIIVDTPGQIEAFTWSSSGSIISQAFSSSMPTVLIYVLDIARCQNPNSLMSNLLFCCSIFYKMKLPLVLIFNKCDAADATLPLSWMEDYEKFQEALSQRSTYLSTLNKQLAFDLDTFYENFNVVQVSSLTGKGFENILPALQKAKDEYMSVTLPDLRQNIQKRKIKEFEQAKIELENFQKSKKIEEKNQQFNVNVLNKNIQEEVQELNNKGFIG